MRFILAIFCFLTIAACGGAIGFIDSGPRTLFDTTQSGDMGEPFTKNWRRIDLVFARNGTVSRTWGTSNVTGTYNDRDVTLVIDGQTYQGRIERKSCEFEGELNLQGTSRMFLTRFYLPC